MDSNQREETNLLLKSILDCSFLAGDFVLELCNLGLEAISFDVSVIQTQAAGAREPRGKHAGGELRLVVLRR